MEIKNVTVAGSGVLGAQVAFQTAFNGFDVVVYDVSEKLLHNAAEKIEKLANTYISEYGAQKEDIDAAIQRINYSYDLGKALQDADLLVEAIVENLDTKIAFYKEAGNLAPQKTIFATNTSTLPISPLAKASGRPGQLTTLHFLNPIAKNNAAEVMMHSQTDTKVFERMIEFAKQIGMIPMPLYKEHPGYITNSFIMPALFTALKLWGDGVADVHTIDKIFSMSFQSSQPIFAMLDIGGLRSTQIIANMVAEQTNDAALKKAADRLQEEFISKGHTGVESGQGFYSYPNPAYLDEDF